MAVGHTARAYRAGVASSIALGLVLTWHFITRMRMRVWLRLPPNGTAGAGRCVASAVQDQAKPQMHSAVSRMHPTATGVVIVQLASAWWLIKG